ncbi:hypothetical protein GCK72_023263 [Caenorhabditis remanei]|uniref:Uncharacterized protein n=1 Tax=Caenorhabditis remanei TaxID=31234 RepID=A0A6A5FWE2_CAERE|nr:hypothetical protein GCK72_023263 [Caenorhabditis remanei]KAF1746805.1 hypothetical protein GCK72_023263 [Caenorhabditis remanei]
MAEKVDKYLKPRMRLYTLIRQADENDGSRVKKRTYWDKYPDLKLFRQLGKRRLISFMFFSYLFMLTASEYTRIIHYGVGVVVAQTAISVFIVLSVLFFDYGINDCRVAMIIPFMSTVMAALSCYICMFGYIAYSVLYVPPYHYFLLGFHFYLFSITTGVTFILAKGADMLWQGFFLLVDLGADEGLLEKLRTNATWEREPIIEKGKKNKRKTGTRYLIAERRRY